MLFKRKITLVDQGQRFYYAGRGYVLATSDEQARHPGNAREQVLAYHVPDRGDRLPVTFNPLVEVFVNSS